MAWTVERVLRGILMGSADLTLKMALIVAVGVFLLRSWTPLRAAAGSSPCRRICWRPAGALCAGDEQALGRTRLAGVHGAVYQNGYVDWKLGIPGIVMSLVGSHFGTKLQLMVPEKYLQYLLLLVLPVVAFVVLRQRQLPEERGQIAPKAQMAIVCVSTFFIGAYDGFYGPGSGTFFLLVFCNLAKMDVRTASGNVKLVNLASNMGALITSLMSGKVFIVLGLIGTVTSFAGISSARGLPLKMARRS